MYAQSLTQENERYRRLEDSRSRLSGVSAEQEGPESNENRARKLEERRSRDLEAKRIGKQLKDMRSSMKKLKKSAPSLKLLLYIDPRVDWAFGAALMAAVLKDFLDWVGFGSLPAIGTVITFMASTVIFGTLLLTGSRSKAKNTKMIVRKFGTLIIGSLMEMLFGLNFIPIESIVVAVTFYMTLVERKETGE